MQCISLTYFQKYLKKLHSTPTTVTDADTGGVGGGSRRGGDGEVNDKEEFDEKKELICGIKCRSKGKRRFFPLIVNEEHAERAYELLCEEIVRSDQLSDHEYESPLDLGAEERHGMGSTEQRQNHEQYFYRIKSNKSHHPHLPDFNCQIALRVISAVMNSMVVMFSTNAGEGKISDPALVGKKFNSNMPSTTHLFFLWGLVGWLVIGFSRFHHMLLYLTKRHPEMTTEANHAIEKFLSHKVCRYKMETPDLGRSGEHSFLPYLPLLLVLQTFSLSSSL